MKIQHLHASRFGNGATVAAELARLMAGRGIAANAGTLAIVEPAA